MEDFFETRHGRQTWPRRGRLPVEIKMCSGMTKKPATPPDLQKLSPPPFSQQPFASPVHESRKVVTEPVVSSVKRYESRDTQDKASASLAGSSSLSPPPSPLFWSCRLAWKLENLKENSPHDRKLQKLKERIRQQRQRSLSWPLREKRLPVCPLPESPSKQPLKRKVCKVAFASPAPLDTGAGGRASKKKWSRSKTSPLPEKTQKEKAVRLYGVSAWREGQKLATKILGPPRQYSKPRSGLDWDTAKLTTESGDLLAMSKAEQSLGGSFQAVQSEKGEGKLEKGASGLNRALREWDSPCGTKTKSMRFQKDPDLEKRAGNWPGRRRNKENASPQCCSTNPPPSVQVEDNRGPLTDHKGRASCSPLRSDSIRKENEATDSSKRPEGWRRSPYSPEEVREFMNKKVAERKRKSWEDRRSSEQAREARRKRLQEVYRKQKEVFRRKKTREEAQGFGAASVTYAKDIHGLKDARDKHPESEVMERVHQVSRALLRDEVKLHRDSQAQIGKMEDMQVDSLENGSVFMSPLKLRDLDHPSFPTAEYSGSPFRSKGPSLGLETPAVSGLSPYRNKEDRVRAIHILARDLSRRLEREMEKLQVGSKLVDLRDQRRLPGTLALSEMPQKAFGRTVSPNATWDSSRSLSLPTQAQQSGEGTFPEDGSQVQIAKRSLRPFLSTPSAGREVSRWASPEEKQSTVGTKGCAVNEGSQTERNFLSEELRAKLSTPSFPLYSERIPFGSSTSSQAEIQTASHQNVGMEDDSTEKHPGLQPGLCGNLVPPSQACCLSSPPANFPQDKTSAVEEETCDRSEPADSTSQWSELSQFYGGSRTFHRFGLKMVEQYLREEELRARHQSALLRLREKALQEKARAELAWLEHEKSCQGSSQDSDGALATAEKQSALLTRLKQEQAEIRHLQNICQAAHQERKLLLKQQKDLLLVQETTAQLWKQLHERLEKSPQQVHSNQKEDTKAPLNILSVATGSESPRDRRSTSPQQSVDTNNLHVESGEILFQVMDETEEFPKQKQALGAENKNIIPAKDFSFCSKQPINSALMDRGCVETGDYLVSKEREEQDHGLIKYSKEDPLGSSMDKEPQCLASGISSDKLRSFSPYLEDSQFESLFHKAHAILIHISGSSLSSFEEAEDAQDTDVSLPEEFIFQEQFHGSSYDGVFCDTPAVPQVAINTPSSSGRGSHTQMSGAHSDQGDLSRISSQEKSLEDTPATERDDGSDSVILSSDGRSRPNSARLRSGQADTITVGRDATSLKDSEPRTGVESVDKMAFQGDVESDAVLACGGTSFYSPKDQKKQGPKEASKTTSGGCNGEDPSRSKPKDESMTVVPKASLKNVDSINDDSVLLTAHNSSKPLLVSDNRNGSVKHSTGESQSSVLGETTTTQLPKISMSDNEIDIGPLHPQATEGTENQNSSTRNSPNTKESGMATLYTSSPKGGKLLLSKNPVQRSEDAAVPPSNDLLAEIEDEILSPVDEVLSYGSTDLPPATEKDISFLSEDLPAPPEDLSEKCGDSNFSLQDFPSPPEQLVFPETGELQFATDEDISIKTNDLPSFSDDHRSEDLLSLPLGLGNVSSLPLEQ